MRLGRAAVKAGMMIIDEATNYKRELISLLAVEGLPAADLPQTLENFLVAIKSAKVVGAIGLEIYGDAGLLRSLAVVKEERGQGIAGKLVKRIEYLAKLKNLSALFLLTETATNYFKDKRFKIIERDEVPALLQASSEFSHVCPLSAVVMKKKLNQ